jgi:hypothetical protein
MIGFWSEPVRLWLLASGRQDIVDRGDAFAQRVTALLVAVRQRADQYLTSDDLYSGAGGGLPVSGDSVSAAMSAIEEFVNVRLRQEISVLESFMSTFDDLRSRPSSGTSFEVAESLSSTVTDGNLAGFVSGGPSSVIALCVTDPGPGPAGLLVSGHSFAAVRAPRSVRRRIFASGH